MRIALLPILAFPLCLTACSGGSEWGTELSKTTPVCEATIFVSENVDAALAERIFQAMVDSNYNFASNLPEQIDRVDGRLTLRLGGDNEESIASIIANGEEDGAVSYHHSMAHHLSTFANDEPIDIILCRESLSDEYYTVKWTPQGE